MFNTLFSKKPEFLFDESENVACVVCDHVISKQRDILLVTHDAEDGQWGFLCGAEDHEMANYRLISLKNVIRIDESVNGLHDMPLGYGAEREKVGASWQAFKTI